MKNLIVYYTLVRHGGIKMNLYVTDSEFMERFEHFAFEEVPNEEGQQLDDNTRYMAILAALIGCQGMEEYRLVLPRALDAGLTPIAVKEIGSLSS